MNSIDRIREALQFIDSGDRETWVRMGMAVKSELGEAGFALWDAWSQRAESYNSRDARDVWRSIHIDGGITIASLFHEAKANGWRGNGRHYEGIEDLAERRRIAARRAAREEAAIASERAEAARKAAMIWSAAAPAQASNPYLARKQVPAVPTLREICADKVAEILGYAPKSGGEPLSGRLLVVPVKQNGELSTLELIDEAGRKTALAGRGTKVCGYWASERLPDGDGAGLTLLIGEGVATVLSASAATRYPGVAALSSGNLPAVAKVMHERYPKSDLVILADLAKATGAPDSNAIEAARSVGGKVAIPDFGADRAPEQTDFNDLVMTYGPEAVRRALVAAKAPEADKEPGASTLHRAVTVRVADVEPQPIRWLWPGRIAIGKLTLLAGDPGLGKSMISLSMAATITRGGRWPDRGSAPLGDVVLLSAEDDVADTIRPRLDAAGADPVRVHVLTMIRDVDAASGEIMQRSFSLRRDVPALAELLTSLPNCRLVVVDPISAYTDGVDTHRNADVRGLLAPLAELAQRHGVAILCVTHLNKGAGQSAIYRTTGSLAFVAAARCSIVVTRDPDDPARRLMLPVKNNLAEGATGLAYRVAIGSNGAPRIEWEAEPVTMTADEALATQESCEDRNATDEAEDWLRELLASGPKRASEVQREARQAGISEKSLRRARERLGIRPKKQGGFFGGNPGWVWELPSLKMPSHAEDAHEFERASSGEEGIFRTDVGVWRADL